MKRTLTLIATLATLLILPETLLADTAPGTMYDRLQHTGKPFAGTVRNGGSGCAGCLGGGCGSRVRKSRAETQMSVIMPMVFKLDLSADQKAAIAQKMRTLQSTITADPKHADAARITVLRAVVATLSSAQRAKLIEHLSRY